MKLVNTEEIMGEASVRVFVQSISFETARLQTRKIIIGV